MNPGKFLNNPDAMTLLPYSNPENIPIKTLFLIGFRRNPNEESLNQDMGRPWARRGKDSAMSSGIWARRVRDFLIGIFIFMVGSLVGGKAWASPGSANLPGLSIEAEGMDNLNTPGGTGNFFFGGGITLQYWISPGIGVRLGADYFNNSKSSGSPLPQSILPFYAGIMINLLSGSEASLDLVGDFGQVLNNGVDNTYADAGLQVNSVLSDRRQFFLEARFREDGIGTMATPWQFVTIGIGVNFF